MKLFKVIFFLIMVSLVFLSGCDLLLGILGAGDDDTKVATPIFSPQPDVYTSAQDVVIVSPTAGAAIYYTTDGFPPTVASTLYTEPIDLDSNTTIKAIAVKEGLENSDIVTGNYFFGTGSGEHVGMLFQPGLWDDDFNVDSYQGLQTAQSQYDIEVSSAEAASTDNVDLLAGLSGLAEDGASLVFGISFWMQNVMADAAVSNPGSHFIGLDASFDAGTAPDNLTGILFAVHESAYLAGILAGLMTFEYASSSEKLNDDNVVGMVLGMEGVPDVERYASGFYAGVKSVNPECEVLSRISGSFADWDQGVADANAMIADGADIIFNIAGYTGIGAMDAADSAGVLAIGVDIDQNDLYPGTVLTSALKDYETAVTYVTGRFLAGNALPAGDNLTLTASEGATGISPFHDLDSIVPQTVKDALTAAEFAIEQNSLLIPEFRENMMNIGVAGAHTGSLAEYGLPALKTLRLLALEANEEGGLLDRWVNIVPADDQLDTELAASAAQELIDSGVVGVIGHTSSGCTETALEDVYSDLGLPILSPSATFPELTEGAYSSFFRTIPRDDVQGSFIAEFAVDEMSATSVALVNEAGNDYQATLAGYVKTAAEALSLTVGYEAEVDFSSDYSTQITALEASGADVVVFLGDPSASANFLETLRGASVSFPVIIGESSCNEDFLSALDTAGTSEADIYSVGYLDLHDLTDAEDFITAYTELFGEAPGAFALNAAAAGTALFDAIQTAETTDSASVVAALEAGSFDTSIGIIEFNAAGDLAGASDFMVRYEIQDGAFSVFTEE